MNKRNIIIIVGVVAVVIAAILFSMAPSPPDPYVVQLEQEVATYAGQIDSLNNTVDGLNGRIDAIRTQLDTAQIANKTLVGALQRVTGELKEYQKLYAEQRELNQKLSAEIRVIKAEKDLAVAEKEQALMQVKETKARVDSLNNALYTKTVRITRLESNLESAQKQMQEMKETLTSVLVYAGTEDELKEAGYLKSWRPALFSKDYRIAAFPEGPGGQMNAKVNKIPLNSAFELTGELEALADRHGKLDKGKEFNVQKTASGNSQITFIDATLLGQRILAVVKKNK